MWTARASCLLVACASSGSLGVGPTLDGDGHVGIELEGAEGPVLDDNAAPNLPPGVWIMGIHGTVGGTTGHPNLVVGAGGFVEYLRLGTLQSPWRFHVRLAVEPSSWADGSLALKLEVGPNYLGSETLVDSNSGPWTHAHTSGLDFTLRVGLHRDPKASPWKLGLVYVRQESIL